MASSVRPLQGGPRIPRGTSPRMNPHHIQTSGHGNANMRYSYTNTPSELHRPVFHQFASPQDSMIEESPISPHEGGRPQSPEHTMNIRVTSEIPSRAHSRSPYNFEPPHGVHPALYAPYAEPVQSPMQHSSDMKPPQSPGPIPIKTHQQPMSPAAPMHGSDDAENKVEYAGINPDADHTPLVYDPNALAGPNVTLDNHRPGQVSHPNAAVDPEWKHGLCEVDTLCCTGLVCPCIVYGKTQYRLSRKAQKQEPTDLLSYKTCNGSCGVMAAACGLQWIFATIQRARVRKLYHLNGSVGDDCVKSLCCCCCVVMQDEREVRDREELIRRHAGPAIGAYNMNPTMSYAPPPR